MKKYPHVLFLDVRTCYCSDELPRSQCIVRLKAILQDKGLTCTVCAPFRAQTCQHRRHMVSQRTLTFPVYRCHPPTLSQDLRFKLPLNRAWFNFVIIGAHACSNLHFYSFANFYAWTTSEFMLGQDLMRFHHHHNHSGRHFP